MPWRIITLDVWGDPEGGWTINQSWRGGTLPREINLQTDERDLLIALQEAGEIVWSARLKDDLDEAARRLNILDEFETLTGKRLISSLPSILGKLLTGEVTEAVAVATDFLLERGMTLDTINDLPDATTASQLRNNHPAVYFEDEGQDPPSLMLMEVGAGNPIDYEVHVSGEMVEAYGDEEEARARVVELQNEALDAGESPDEIEVVAGEPSDWPILQLEWEPRIIVEWQAPDGEWYTVQETVGNDQWDARERAVAVLAELEAEIAQHGSVQVGFERQPAVAARIREE